MGQMPARCRRPSGTPIAAGALEVVQVFEVPEQVSPAPGVQGAGQVPVRGVAVADDDALVAGQHLAGVDDPGCVAATRELQQRYPQVGSEDIGGR